MIKSQEHHQNTTWNAIKNPIEPHEISFKPLQPPLNSNYPH